jgi:hypothetical protein
MALPPRNPPRPVGRPQQASPQAQRPVARPAAQAARPVQARPGAVPARAPARAPSPANNASRFQGIENAKVMSRNPLMNMPGLYYVETLEAKHTYSTQGAPMPMFIGEFKVLACAEQPQTVGKVLAIINKSRYPESLMGFIKGYVAAALNVGEEEVTSDFTADAITLDDGPPGQAVGTRLLVQVSEKIDKKTKLPSDFPNWNFYPDDGSATGSEPPEAYAEGVSEYVDADGNPCDADGNPLSDEDVPF